MLRGRVDVRVKNCVLVMVEVMVAYEGTRNKGSRIKVNRIVIISSEREKKMDGQGQAVSCTGSRLRVENGTASWWRQSGKKREYGTGAISGP